MTNEVAFALGLTRAYIDPPVPGEHHHTVVEPVYMTEHAIRIKREALLGQYEFVVQEVVRISRLSPLYVDLVLQAIRQRIGG